MMDTKGKMSMINSMINALGATLVSLDEAPLKLAGITMYVART